MTAKEFERIMENQINRCREILGSKAGEYAAEDDRLHNFRVAAVLQGIPIKQAIAGMMAKHTVSIYDMCTSEKTYPIELWDEKITDHLNYLLLLRAVVEEEP